MELALPAPQHILDHLDNFISFFSITMASLMTFKSFDTHYLTLERAVPYVAVGVYNQIILITLLVFSVSPWQV